MRATPGTIVSPFGDEPGYAGLVQDRKRTAWLIGPGVGVDAATRQGVEAALATAKPGVLDADALTVFADDPAALFSQIKGPCVLTPHEGEFRRLFDPAGDKLGRARAAARCSGAVVLLKGPIPSSPRPTDAPRSITTRRRGWPPPGRATSSPG